MPADGVCKKRHDQMLTEEEMICAVRAAAQLSVTKLRITGGEPLVKKNILSICGKAAQVPGIREVCMTTNGILLPGMAAKLKAAGVKRINISLDTLDPEKYQFITRGGNLDDALRGIEAALRAGFGKVKINTVLIGGFNDDEIPALAKLTLEYPLDVRFIEWMPMQGTGDFGPEAILSGQEVVRRLPELEEVQRRLPELGEVQRRLPEPDGVQRRLPELEEVQRRLPEPDGVQRHLPELEEVQRHLPEPDGVQRRLPEPDGVQRHQTEAPETGSWDGVAKLYRLPGALGNIGIILPISDQFCRTCSRIRITADGWVKPCLHQPAEYSIKGMTQEQMVVQLQAAIRQKPQWHGELSASRRSRAGRNMNRIGG